MNGRVAVNASLLEKRGMKGWYAKVTVWHDSYHRQVCMQRKERKKKKQWAGQEQRKKMRGKIIIKCVEKYASRLKTMCVCVMPSAE